MVTRGQSIFLNNSTCELKNKKKRIQRVRRIYFLSITNVKILITYPSNTRHWSHVVKSIPLAIQQKSFFLFADAHQIKDVHASSYIENKILEQTKGLKCLFISFG